MYILRLALKAKVTNFSTQFYEEVNNKSSTQTENFQMFKLNLEKAEEPEMKLPISVGSSKKQESSGKTSTFALLTMPKPLTVWIITNWKIQEYQTT